MNRNRLVNLGNHNQKSLNECGEKGLPGNLQNDPPPQFCENNGTRDDGWLEDASNKKIGLGENQLCDPVQTGQIINDPNEPNPNVIYRYTKAIRGCDEAVMDMFKNIVVLDEDGKAHPVPIIWATQERAVAAILQDNVRKDNTVVVDRIKLPMLAIYSNSFDFDQDRYIYHQAVDFLRNFEDGTPGFTIKNKYERDTVFGVSRGIPINVGYTLYAWTKYLEDMNQIMEQIVLKFSPVAYIRVRGVQWETIVKLNTIANNLEVEPGDKTLRIIKFQFDLTAQTFIPQPIRRHKTVLNTDVKIFNNTELEDETTTINTLKEKIKEV